MSKEQENKIEREENWDVPPSDEEYTLEEILAEYGSSRQQKILEEVEREAEPETVSEPALPAEPAAPAAEEPPAAERKPAAEPKPARMLWARRMAHAESEREAELPEEPEESDEPENEPEDEPEESRLLSLEELVGTTVGAVMEEHREPLLKPKRGLFSRKRQQEDTEQFYDPMDAPPPPKPVTEADTIGDEPELSEIAAEYREDSQAQSRPLIWALLTALVPLAALAAEQYGVNIPYWTGDGELQCVVVLALLLINLVLCRYVPVYGFRQLREKRCTGALLVTLAAAVSAADCLLCLFHTGRAAAVPYAPVASAALFFAQWGISRENRGNSDSFRMASLDDNPPYLVTETGRGACKQKGSLRGFYTTASRTDYASRLQAVFLPLILAASVVFAGLTSLGEGRGADFLLNLSAILTAGATFSLPLCWGLPWARLTRRQQKSGCAVAGWDGATRMGKRRSLILTDIDRFPPGTIRLNGVKVYGEELSKAAAYAAAAAHGAGCGLARVFDGLAVGENAPRETAQDLSFYEQGGFGCTIHGESVLLGTASFMRKQDVRLPGNINLKTGVFLAIDHQLAAVFAVKYEAAENVDYALRTMRRSRITPILAVRDPNITPALLKRKFSKRIKVEYPDLTDRVALSEAEEDRGLPRALLLREGLLPYAEAVVGSRRLRTAVRRASWLSLLGSGTGVLLTAYLVSLQKFDLLTPLSLTVFLLLWTLPVLLLSDWTGRY